MKKYQIFTILALALITFCFTVPVIGFNGVMNKIKTHNINAIPSYSYNVWNLYKGFQYESPNLPKGANESLEKMLETRAEVGVASIPIWKVSLEAPNYPKDAFPDGIPVFFHFDGYSGDVQEMNTINHYIGMYPMEHGGKFERKIVPYFFLILTLMMIAYLYTKNKYSWFLMAIPSVLPFAFLIDYAGWLYWYGHNMQEWGAFTIKPFMPTVFGDGKVAQFTTHSYPSIGFYILIIVSILSILAIFSKKKELKSK
ncbi:putative membrane protein [Malaciobacter marinus]|uniref:Cytochrome C n=1 Tax=Malaciobacter marinus TaxID=505249 RepID=A0A347TMR1_9BACT|nr:MULTISPECIES: cytochrome C [Malaciobacter]AXX87889.1 putative membrane protein [Malaciobacter marinus]PHO15406.1 cytochrome C [Malaciobacter marinus]RYA24708.1 cytochrome C [Malaciobacter halophilus]